MSGIIGDIHDRNNRGVSVYSPTRQVRQPGRVANAGTAQRVASPYGGPPTGGGSGISFNAPQAPGAAAPAATGTNPLLASWMQHQQQAAATAGQPDEPAGWQRALGTVANSPIAKAAFASLDALDLPRRAVVSTVREGVDVFTGNNDASWDDFVNQVGDTDFGFGDVVGSTGNIWADRTIGFVGDVVLDPTTYIAGSGVLSGAGRRARGGLAARMIEAGLSPEMAERAGRLGAHGLDDGERALVRSVLGEAAEEGAMAVGDEALMRSGMYWKTPFVDGYHRIPFTGGIDRVIGGTFAKGRAAINETPLFQAVFGRFGDEITGEAMRRLTSGKGRLALTEAAEVINAAQAKKYGTNMAKRQAHAARMLLSKEVGDEGLNIMIDEAETKGGTAINAFFGRLAKMLDDMGIDHGFIEKYVPHYYTGNGAAWLQGNSETAKAFTSIFTQGSHGLDDFNPSMMKRHFIGRDVPYNINGKEFHIPTGTIAEINAEFKRVTGETFDLLETDFRKIADRYVGGFGDDIGTMTAVKRLLNSKSKLAFKANDNEVLSKIVKTISAKTANAEKTKELEGQLASLIADRDLLAKELGTNVRGVAGVLGDRMGEMITSLRTVRDVRAAKLNDALERDRLLSAMRGVTSYDGVTTGEGSLTRELDLILAETDAEIAEVARERAAWEGRAKAEQYRMAADLAAAKGSPQALGERYQALAKFKELQQRELDLMSDRARLGDMADALAAANAQAAMAAKLSNDGSFLSSVLNPDASSSVNDLRSPKGSAAGENEAFDDFEVETPQRVEKRASSHRRTVLAPETFAASGHATVPGAQDVFNGMLAVSERISSHYGPAAARADENYLRVLSVESVPISIAKENYQRAREVEASWVRWLDEAAGRPDAAAQIEEMTQRLEELRAADGLLGRASSEYDALRSKVTDAREQAEGAAANLRHAEDRLSEEARKLDTLVAEYNATPPVTLATRQASAAPVDGPVLPMSPRQESSARSWLRRYNERVTEWSRGRGAKREKALTAEAKRVEGEMNAIGGRLHARIDGFTGVGTPNREAAKGIREFGIDANGNLAYVTPTMRGEIKQAAKDEADLARQVEELASEIKTREVAHTTAVADLESAVDDAARAAAGTRVDEAFEALDGLRTRQRKLQGQLFDVRHKGEQRNQVLAGVQGWLDEYRGLEQRSERLQHLIERNGRDVAGARQKIRSLTENLDAQDAARKSAAELAAPRPAASHQVATANYSDDLKRITANRDAYVERTRPSNYRTVWEDVPALDGPTSISGAMLTPVELEQWEAAKNILANTAMFGGENSQVVRQAHNIIANLHDRPLPLDFDEVAEGTSRYEQLTTRLSEISDLRTPWSPTSDQRKVITGPVGLRARGGNTRLGTKGGSAASKARSVDNLRRAKRAHRIATWMERKGVVDDLLNAGAIPTQRIAEHVRGLTAHLGDLIKARSIDASPYVQRRIEQAMVDVNRWSEFMIRYQRAIELGIEPSNKVGTFIASVALSGEAASVKQQIRDLRAKIRVRGIDKVLSKSQKERLDATLQRLADVNSKRALRQRDPLPGPDFGERFIMPNAEKIAKGWDPNKPVAIHGMTNDDFTYELTKLGLELDIEADRLAINDLTDSAVGGQLTSEAKGQSKIMAKRIKRNQAKLDALPEPTYGMMNEIVDAVYSTIESHVLMIDGSVSDYNFVRNQLHHDKTWAASRKVQLEASIPKLEGELGFYRAENTRLGQAILRAEREGSDVVRWKPTRHDKFSMTVQEAEDALLAGEIPEYLQPRIRQELDKYRVTEVERVTAAIDVPAVQGAITQLDAEISRLRKQYPGAITDMPPEVQSTVAQLEGLKRKASEQLDKAGQQSARETARDMEQAAYRASFAPGPPNQRKIAVEHRDKLISGDILAPLDHAGVREMPIDEAIKLQTGNSKAIEDITDSIDRDKILQRVLDGTIVDDIKWQSQIIKDQEQPPDVEALLATTREMVNRAKAGGRELSKEESDKIEFTLRRVKELRESGPMAPEVLARAKSQLATMKNAVEQYRSLMGDDWYRHQSLIDGGNQFITDLTSGARKATAEDAQLLANLLGAEEGLIAGSMARRFNELFGGQYQPIRRSDIVSMREAIGDVPLPESSWNRRVVEASAQDPTPGELKDLRRELADMMSADANPDVLHIPMSDQAKQRAAQWISGLDYLLDDERRALGTNIANMSQTDIAERLNEFILEFGASPLTEAFERASVNFADTGSAAQVNAMRDELRQAMVNGAKTEYQQQLREAVQLSQRLGVKFNTYAPGFAGKMQAMGYSLSGQRFTPKTLRKLIIDELKRGGYDMTETAQAKLGQLSLLSSRLETMRRGLGVATQGVESSMDPHEIAALIGRTRVDDVEGFDKAMTMFMAETEPESVAEVLEGRIAHLQDDLEVAEKAGDMDAVRRIMTELNTLDGQRMTDVQPEVMPPMQRMASVENAELTAKRDAAREAVTEARSEVERLEKVATAEARPLARNPLTPEGLYSLAEFKQLQLDLKGAAAEDLDRRAALREQAMEVQSKLWNQEPDESKEAAELSFQQIVGASSPEELAAAKKAHADAITELADLEKQLQSPRTAEVVDDGSESMFEGATTSVFDETDEAKTLEQLSTELEETTTRFTGMDETANPAERAATAARLRKLTEIRNTRAVSERDEYLRKIVPSYQGWVSDRASTKPSVFLDWVNVMTTGTPSRWISQRPRADAMGAMAGWTPGMLNFEEALTSPATANRSLYDVFRQATSEHFDSEAAAEILVRNGFNPNAQIKSLDDETRTTLLDWARSGEFARNRVVPLTPGGEQIPDEVLRSTDLRFKTSGGRLFKDSPLVEERTVRAQLAPADAMRDELLAAQARASGNAAIIERQMAAMEGRDLDAEIEAVAKQAAEQRRIGAQGGPTVEAAQQARTASEAALKAERINIETRRVAALDQRRTAQRRYNAELARVDAELAQVRKTIIDLGSDADMAQLDASIARITDAINHQAVNGKDFLWQIEELRKINAERRKLAEAKGSTVTPRTAAATPPPAAAPTGPRGATPDEVAAGWTAANTSVAVTPDDVRAFVQQAATARLAQPGPTDFWGPYDWAAVARHPGFTRDVPGNIALPKGMVGPPGFVKQGSGLGVDAMVKRAPGDFVESSRIAHKLWDLGYQDWDAVEAAAARTGLDPKQLSEQSVRNVAGPAAAAVPPAAAAPPLSKADQVRARAAGLRAGPDALASMDDYVHVEALLAEAQNHARKLATADAGVELQRKRLAEFAANAPKSAEAVTYKLADGWTPIATNLLTGADSVVIATTLANAMRAMKEGLTDPGYWKFLDSFTRFFKTYATATPGFHSRNIMSASFMNLVDRVKLRHMTKAPGIWMAFERDPFGYIDRVGANSDIGKALKVVFASGAAGQWEEVGVEEGSSWLTRKIMDNRLTRWNHRLGSRVEGSARLAMALDSFDKGMSPAAALERVTKYHFDYTEMGSMDATMRRLIPFWTFLSRNLPLQLESMWLRPRTYLQYESLKRNFGEPVDPLTPAYWLDQGAWTMQRGQGEGDNEGDAWYLAPDLPHLRVADPLAALARGDLSRVGLTDINPLIMAPLEAAGFHKDLFTGAPIEGYSQPEGAMAALTPLFNLLGQTETGGTSGETLVGEGAQHLARSLLPPLNLLERLTSTQGVRAGRQGETLARAMLGAPAYRLTPELRKQQEQSAYYDQLDERQAAAELARS